MTVDPHGGDTRQQAVVPASAVSVARQQFQLFHDVTESLRLSAQECRRALSLSEAEWFGWSNFLRTGAMPAEPKLPDMLRRLASATYDLSASADRFEHAA